MSEKMMENDKVSVIGEIVSGFTFSHEVFGEGFYMVSVAVNRLRHKLEGKDKTCPIRTVYGIGYVWEKGS